MLRDGCGMEYRGRKNDRARPSLLSVWVEERTRRKASHGQFVQKRRVLEAWLMETVLERHVFTCGRSRTKQKKSRVPHAVEKFTRPSSTKRAEKKKKKNSAWVAKRSEKVSALETRHVWHYRVSGNFGLVAVSKSRCRNMQRCTPLLKTTERTLSSLASRSRSLSQKSLVPTPEEWEIDRKRGKDVSPISPFNVTHHPNSFETDFFILIVGRKQYSYNIKAKRFHANYATWAAFCQRHHSHQHERKRRASFRCTASSTHLLLSVVL